MYHALDFPGHNFVFGLRTLKPKNLKKLFLKEPRFFSHDCGMQWSTLQSKLDAT